MPGRLTRFRPADTGCGPAGIPRLAADALEWCGTSPAGLTAADEDGAGAGNHRLPSSQAVAAALAVRAMGSGWLPPG